MDLIVFLVTQDNSSVDSLLLLFNKNNGKHQESKLIPTPLTKSNRISYLRARDYNHKVSGKVREMNSPKTGSN